MMVDNVEKIGRRSEWRKEPAKADNWIGLGSLVFDDANAFVDRYHQRTLVDDTREIINPVHDRDTQDLYTRMFHRTGEAFRFGIDEGILRIEHAIEQASPELLEQMQGILAGVKEQRAIEKGLKY